MTLKGLIWRRILDPIILRIERRITHLQDLRSLTHDGARWKEVSQVGRSAVFYPEAELVNLRDKSALVVGDNCHIRGEILVYGAGAFKIGSHSYLGPGSRIWARESVTIGSHVLISHFVDIHDSNAHSLDWRSRREETLDLFERGSSIRPDDVSNAPICIEDDVWIGFKSTILKGVTIGRGAVVAAGSVVLKDVAPFTLVAGNPARLVRELSK